ncbi:MAG: hypothetical protein ACJA09_001112 [Alcanivorax sp.]|jgi:hypothetical protein
MAFAISMLGFRINLRYSIWINEMNLKKPINRVLQRLGLQLVKTNEDTNVRFENFANLANAFEYTLEQPEKRLPKNDIRHKLMARLLGTPPTEAYYIVRALADCAEVTGDICEFGVAQGETSALIANEIKSHADKSLHLFDSFEGLPPPTEKDQLKDDIFKLGSIDAYAGTMSCPEDLVRNRLKAIEFPSQRCVIHKGFIEASLTDNIKLPKSVSFAYVDFDFYEPILIALRFLDPITPSGAIIIVDDYDFFSTGAKVAVDEFVAQMNADSVQYRLSIPEKDFGHFAILSKC